MSLFRFSFASVWSGFHAPTLFAALFAYDGFDYPIGSLEGHNGGFGWQLGANGAWNDLESTSPSVSAGSKSYTDAGGHQLVTSDNRAAFPRMTTQDPGRTVFSTRRRLLLSWLLQMGDLARTVPRFG